jgi:hypothetical protein
VNLSACLACSAHGGFAGLRDTYIIDSKPFSPSEQQQQDAGITSVCTCTYSTASSAYGQPPYVSMVMNKGFEPPTFKTYLDFCDEPKGGQAMFNFSGPDGELMTDVMNEYFFHLTNIRIAAPTSAIMLPEEGWKAARMTEAQREWQHLQLLGGFKSSRTNRLLGHWHTLRTTSWHYWHCEWLHCSLKQLHCACLKHPHCACQLSHVCIGHAPGSTLIDAQQA